MFKPFRSPLLQRPTNLQSEDALQPPTKKRRSNHEVASEISGPHLVFKQPGISSLPRKPLVTVQNPGIEGLTTSTEGVEGHYNVLWRKYTAKKHKTWDGDGVLHVSNGYAYLQDMSGKEMGRTPCEAPLLPGSSLSIGGKEVEVDSMLSKSDYLAGRPFLNTSGKKPLQKVEATLPALPKPARPSKPPLKATKDLEKEEDERPRNIAAPRSLGTQASYRNPLPQSTELPVKNKEEPTPRHDPTAPNAIVMKRPESAPKGRQIVDVVVDPLLSQHLREHQREGVKFMYECVMGMRDFGGQGAILADEMGLGKTLQTIALLWTLLKQHPVYEDPPVIKKALIVCPVTLINNWRKEFRKWLGTERIGVFVADEKKKRLTDFTMGRSYNVMIIGYEKLRIVQEELKKGPGIDIVIADEGHRLKTAKNKSAQAIKALNTARRIILSGTPIQNDLSEFFMMVDFVNPDLLGSFKKFTQQFEVPIVKSRQPEATEKEIELGEARSEELASLTSPFILRRTADVLSEYLPPKTEYVLLCRPTTNQTVVYQRVLSHPVFQTALGSSEASLQLITILKKVCNSPSLLNPKDPSASVSPMTASLVSSIPTQLLHTNAGATKIRALDQLLHNLRTTTSDKVVLVSNYTSTLDLLSTLLSSLDYSFVRLDGRTPSSKRQEIVDNFNRTPASTCFAFLLSAKAGGVGLNLIGASRLVLFDVDWNPATDLQAMARIHRDGQKNPCFIYRFLMAGAIDEKIWQRQATKLGLASNIMDQKRGAAAGGNSFSRDELRDLFRLDQSPSCQTHELLGCPCQGRGLPPDPAVDEEASWTVLEDAEPQPEEASDSEFDLPRPRRRKSTFQQQQRGLVQVNKLDMRAQEQVIREEAPRRESKMENLMAYTHIDTSGFNKKGEEENLEALVQDPVLLRVLRDEDNRISFVFAKMSS